MTWKENLIKLYFYICEDRQIQNYLGGLRMSNNYKPEFTDEEVMTVYVFGITQQFSKVKQIHNYTKQHLSEWFPLLPSYPAFNNRLHKLHGCFEILVRSVNAAALHQLDFTGERVIETLYR